jgi:hypothetical protein
MFASEKELGAGANKRSRGRSPPNPPTLYYITKELRLSSLFRKIFFFFFNIYPLLLYHILVAVVKYFSKTFFKKFSKFLLTFGSRCDIIILKKGGLGEKSSFWRG